MSEKSSWLSDDAASSSSEDMSTTAGWRDVMGVRRAYAYSPQRGVNSSIHLRNSFGKTWAGGFPGTREVFCLTWYVSLECVTSSDRMIGGQQ